MGQPQDLTVRDTQTGKDVTIEGWSAPINAANPSAGRENVGAQILDHALKGYGVNDAEAGGLVTEILGLQWGGANRYTKNGNPVAVIPTSVVLQTIQRLTQGNKFQARDVNGTGHFPGGYAQLASASPAAARGGPSQPSEFWASRLWKDRIETREFDNPKAAINFMLEQAEIDYAADATFAEKQKLWADAGYPRFDVQPGQYGGFAVVPFEEDEEDAEPGPPSVVGTEQGLYQLAGGEWSPLGLPSAPASMEYMGGMLWMRGTDGSLAPVNNVLERMVEQKILEGDWETALQWDDFRNRPTPQEHLQSMLDYARTPADQVLLSAIARGYMEGMVPPEAGSLARVGPIPQEATAAWERYERSITGGPAREEMEEFLASEQAEKEQDKANYFQSLQDMRDSFQDTLKGLQQSNDKKMKSFMDAVTSGMEKMGSSITSLGSSVSKAAGEDYYDVFTTGEGAGQRGDSERGDSEKGGAGTQADPFSLEVLKQEWANTYQGMHLPAITEGMSDEELTAWLKDKNNWPDPVTLQPSVSAGEKIETLTEEFDELEALRSQYEKAAEQVEDFPGGYPGDATVFGARPGTVDWGSEDVIAGTAEDDDPGVSVPETQFVYQKADPSWSGANLYTGDVADDSWQAAYFEPLAEKEQRAMAQGYSSGLSDYAYEEFAGGGVVQGPTLALLGEKESEVVIPFSKIDAFRRGALPIKNPKVTRTGSKIAEFAEGGLVFGPEEIESRGGVGNVGAVPGISEINNPRYITNETLEGLRGGSLKQNPDDPYDIYSAGGRTTETTESLDAAQREYQEQLTRPATFEESLANVTGGEQGNLPIGVQQVLAGRSPRPLAGRLLRQAGMALPSAQAWRNLSPDEREVYTDVARRSGITEGYLKSEMATATPSGGGGARRARMLPLATRRIFR